MLNPALFFLFCIRVLVLASATFLHCSCHSSRPALTPEELIAAAASDRQVLENIESHNVELRREFLALRSTGNWKTLGYFSAQESDRTELLYFRFHTAHHQLNEIVERYGKVSKAHPMSTRANRLALEQSHFLVKTFADDKIAIDKLNQAYPRSGIPRNTYDRQVESLEPVFKRGATIAKVKATDKMDDAEYLAQTEIFFHVSRLKKPNAHLVSFSESQKQEVVSQLQPGDILLTFTAGYASDVFIPGAFKHGITFIGTVAQRHAAGLSPDKIILVGGRAEGQKIRKDLEKSTTVGGRPANLIEAVAEGVKLSNLEYIMDTHINRLLVLRPTIGATERAKQVSRTFSYLGQDYDFRFDFADSSKQVCTEVIYRAINGLDDINFTLTRRGGHVTLSADDIVNYWLHKNPGAFELILYAEESSNSLGHRARILTGMEGKTRVTELMASGGKD
ncbi:YiiX/YebB-like N1pC/P60 family cysteine hydrolase [Haloferula sp.]|uniref:YiiX/YebB-like N1pC/P60 family cysteine hydrolase n=1 Tax=Haloferula sp. TaxID=2497595 RepID=UPI003C75C8A2